MRICLLLIIFFSAHFAMANTNNHTVYFEPKWVELKGIINILTFPGPPNYENIHKGDAKEVGVYLVLDKAINIKLIPKIQIGNDEPRKNVKIVQLIISPDLDCKKIRHHLKTHVS